MDDRKYTYYRIKDTNTVARGSEDEYWIYTEGKWVEDTANRVSDMIHGYDPYEPEDSPYGFGDTDIMNEIEHISYEEAMAIIAADRQA